MKEFAAQDGGRYTYADDVMNLQELALAFGHIFDGCDNFVLSGCDITGSTMAAGFVWINGKVRYCEGTSSIPSYPFYIVEHNSVENVDYANASNKVGRTIYGCRVSASIPSVNDVITNKPPQYIAVTSAGFPTIREAFFGKYALLLNSKHGAQSLANPLNVNGGINVQGDVSASNGFKIPVAGGLLSVAKTSVGCVISNQSGGSTYNLTIKDNGDLQYSHGDSVKMIVSGGHVQSLVPFHALSTQSGNVKISDADIYNAGSASNASLSINMKGYNGGTSYYRDMIIGNGKGGELARFKASVPTCELNTSMLVNTDKPYVLTLKNNKYAKTDNAYVAKMQWTDNANSQMAYMGFASSTDKVFSIKNGVGDIVIDNAVTVTGNLVVNGSINGYTPTAELTSQLSLKANAAEVYSKTKADSTFVKKTDSIEVFVTQSGGGNVGKKAVCQTIGAVTSEDFQKAVVKDQSFKDIAEYGLPLSSDSTYTQKRLERQKQLCENIGAIHKNDAALKQKDTGWQYIVQGDNVRYPNIARCRQIGNIVTIEGWVMGIQDNVFTLPNSIDPPVNMVSCYNTNMYFYYDLKNKLWNAVQTNKESGLSLQGGFISVTYFV